MQNKIFQQKVNKDVLNSVSWDLVAKKMEKEKEIVGTSELSQVIFNHLTITPSAKLTYLTHLSGEGHFPKEDGLLGRLKYWHKNTVIEFAKNFKVKQQIETQKLAESENFLKDFENLRKEFVKKLSAMGSNVQKIAYFKTDILPELLEKLDNAPHENSENTILSEIGHLWRFCRGK